MIGSPIFTTRRFAEITAGPGRLRTSMKIEEDPVRTEDWVEVKGKVFQEVQVKLPAWALKLLRGGIRRKDKGRERNSKINQSLLSSTPI